MVVSKLTPEQRLNRKRQAARLRQQRCRARKKQALLERQRKEKEEILASHGAVTRMPVGQEARVTSSRTPPIEDGSHQSSRKLHLIPASLSYDESPRSVYWPHNYGGHYLHHQRRSWSDQPRQQIRQVHSADSAYFPASRLAAETRYESDSYERSPYYQRYQPSPPAFHPPPPPTMPIFRQPMFHPPVEPVCRLMQHQQHHYVPTRRPQPAKHTFAKRPETTSRPTSRSRDQELEKRESLEEIQVQQPTKPVEETKKKEETVEKSKEQAAVDAILSLKSGGIVAPPQIKRLVRRDQSAFKIYPQMQNIHRESLKPGFYLSMRSN